MRRERGGTLACGGRGGGGVPVPTRGHTLCMVLCARLESSRLKSVFGQDLDDAELDYLGIIDPRQRARILTVKECFCQDLDDAELDYPL